MALTNCRLVKLQNVERLNLQMKNSIRNLELMFNIFHGNSTLEFRPSETRVGDGGGDGTALTVP